MMFEFLLFVIVAQACLENPFSTQLMKFPVNKFAHEIEIVVRLVAEPKHLQNSITVPTVSNPGRLTFITHSSIVSTRSFTIVAVCCSLSAKTEQNSTTPKH